MPVLASYASHSAASRTSTTSSGDSNSGSTPPLLSELTRVGHASTDSVVLAATVATDSAISLSLELVGSQLQWVSKAQDNIGTQTHTPSMSNDSPLTDYEDDTAMYLSNALFLELQQQQAPLATSALYDCVNYDMDLCMQTPSYELAASLVSSSSPISWQHPSSQSEAYFHSPANRASVHSAPPPIPPSLPPQFRASATWITPEQRNSGYSENLMLNATLFETIRRKASLSNDEDSDYSHSDNSDSPRTSIGQRPQIGRIHAAPVAKTEYAAIASEYDDSSEGVYIPTWRKAEASTTSKRSIPLWAEPEYGEESGLLCEAAGLNFDLYETLHKRR
ncbi:hypothetical protein GGF37_001156 [Kickxella alabastrina]|nr:hypothetical protein GGF37_001156 [Kickxella alabastrina]